MIPARLQSTRLPRKLLLDNTGMPLLAYTIRLAQRAVAVSGGLFREVVVACDDSQLIQVAHDAGVRGVLTSDAHPNGTSRIAEAMQAISDSASHAFVLNLQGDQPELLPEAMIQVGAELVAHPLCEMATGAVECASSDAALFANLSVVKVEFDSSGCATDFWRQPASNVRADLTERQTWYRHIGIYAYRADFLQRYVATPPSVREQLESLEQLRALEMGAAIRVCLITAEQAGRAIDTPQDYAEFTDRMRQQKAASR